MFQYTFQQHCGHSLNQSQNRIPTHKFDSLKPHISVVQKRRGPGICHQTLTTIHGAGGPGVNPMVRRMSETPTATTAQKSIAIHLSFVSQSASNCFIAVLLVPLGSQEKEILSILVPFVSQYASHLYCNTPPICIAVLLRRSWWLWSPGCSPNEWWWWWWWWWWW